MLRLTPEQLTSDVFSQFGDVIDARESDFFPINSGRTRRHHDLIDIQTFGHDSKPCVSIFVSQGISLPASLESLERHPLGSQAFVPLNRERFLIVVAPPGDTIAPDSVRAFVTDGRQGVNYHAGTWHAVHSVLGQEGEFLVIDRSGTGNNCDEYPLDIHVSA